MDAAKTGSIITIEEHNINGGLGNAVAEVLMEEGAGDIKFKRIALPEVNVSEVGGQQWLLKQFGLDPLGIGNSIRVLIEA